MIFRNRLGHFRRLVRKIVGVARQQEDRPRRGFRVGYWDLAGRVLPKQCTRSVLEIAIRYSLELLGFTVRGTAK